MGKKSKKVPGHSSICAETTNKLMGGTLLRQALEEHLKAGKLRLGLVRVQYVFLAKIFFQSLCMEILTAPL